MGMQYGYGPTGSGCGLLESGVLGIGRWELTELQCSRDAACSDHAHRRRTALPQQRVRIRRSRRPPSRPQDGRRGEDAARSHRSPVRARCHGHRDPRRVRRQRRDLLSLRAGRRGAVASRPVRRRARRRPQHAGHQRAAPLGSDQQKRTYPASPRPGHRRRLRACRRPARAATRSRWPLAPPRAATATSSTAASSGSRTATRPTSSSSSPTSIPMPATAASPRSSSSAARPASRSARRKTSSASAPAARAS